MTDRNSQRVITNADEAALAFARFGRTKERNALLLALFPEGIGMLDQEKVAARIRKHFPEVPRRDIYAMNPAQLAHYLREVLKAEKASPPESARAPKPKTQADRDVRYLGDCRLRIAGKTVTLTAREDSVLAALVSLQSASKQALEETSGYGDAVRVLRGLVNKYHKLKKWITFPGKKGHGGYQTTVRAT